MTPQPRPVTAPTREDPVAAALSDRVGGPAGEHAGRHWWWTPLRVVLAVFTVVFCLSLVQHTPCVHSHWQDSSTRYEFMCYSDVPYLYTDRGFAEQQWPYSAGNRYPAMEYPPVISYAAWLASEVTALVPQGPPEYLRAATSTKDLWSLPGIPREVNEYFFVTAVGLFCCGIAASGLLVGVRRRRPWDALPFALSPTLLLAGLVNWDLMAVVCVAGALFAWSRGRPLWAGVLVGLGTATKLYPLFLLGAFLIPALRRDRDDGSAGPAARRGFVVALAGAAVAWTLAQVPAWLGDFSRWEVFWSFNAARGPDLGSWWLVLSHLGATASAHTVNVVSWLLFGAACLAILVLGVRAPRAPRVAQVGYLVVAAFLIVNKVYSPQYVLWLLPLAVLARPRWRDLLIWQAGELIYFGAVWIYLAGGLAAADGTSTPAYGLAICVRIAAEVYFAVQVVRDIRTPALDPVRRDEEAGERDGWDQAETTTRSNLVIV